MYYSVHTFEREINIVLPRTRRTWNRQPISSFYIEESLLIWDVPEVPAVRLLTKYEGNFSSRERLQTLGCLKISFFLLTI